MIRFIQQPLYVPCASTVVVIFLTHTQKKESYITEFIVNGGNLHETECNHAHSDQRTVTLA